MPTALPGTAASTISGENKADTPSATRKIVYRRSSPLLWLPLRWVPLRLPPPKLDSRGLASFTLMFLPLQLTIVELLYGFVSILSIRHLDEPWATERFSGSAYVRKSRTRALFARFSAMSETLETEVWSEQDLNFQPRFSSARRQPIVTFSVFEAIVASRPGRKCRRRSKAPETQSPMAVSRQ